LEKLKRSDSIYIFPGKAGGQRKYFSKVARRVRDRAGLPKNFRPLHGLRHTFASWMASSGSVDLFTLQKLLTHHSPQMTQRYAHLADEALQRAASVAGEIFQGVSGSSERAAVISLRREEEVAGQ
jgi:integrase